MKSIKNKKGGSNATSNTHIFTLINVTTNISGSKITVKGTPIPILKSCTEGESEVALNTLCNIHNEPATTLPLTNNFKTIGSGNFGNVFEVRKCKTPNEILVFKQIKLSANDIQTKATQTDKNVEVEKKFQKAEIQKEIDILCLLKSFPGVTIIKNYIEPYEAIIESGDTSKGIIGGILLENCDQGDLESYYNSKTLQTIELFSIVEDILKAVGFLHSHNLLHLDIASRNILVKTGDNTNSFAIKLADFGLSSSYKTEKHSYNNIFNIDGKMNQGRWIIPTAAYDVNYHTYSKVDYLTDVWGVILIVIDIYVNYKMNVKGVLTNTKGIFYSMIKKETADVMLEAIKTKDKFMSYINEKIPSTTRNSIIFPLITSMVNKFFELRPKDTIDNSVCNIFQQILTDELSKLTPESEVIDNGSRKNSTSNPKINPDWDENADGYALATTEGQLN